MAKGTRKFIVLLFVFLVGFIFFYIMDASEERIVSSVSRERKLIDFLNFYITWHSLKSIFLGLAIGVLALPLIYIVSAIVYYELRLEALFGKKIYVVSSEPKVSIYELLKHSYLLFSPIIILTRIISTFANVDILSLYFAIGDSLRSSLWLLFLTLTLPFIVIDYSRVRALDEKRVLVKFPSSLFNFVGVILLGAGSIASAVPIFFEIIDKVKDIQLAQQLFVYSIALFYVPSLALVTSSYLVFFLLDSDTFRSCLGFMEKRIEERFGTINI